MQQSSHPGPTPAGGNTASSSEPVFGAQEAPGGHQENQEGQWWTKGGWCDENGLWWSEQEWAQFYEEERQRKVRASLACLADGAIHWLKFCNI